jgi:hypothetical protein
MYHSADPTILGAKYYVPLSWPNNIGHKILCTIQLTQEYWP